MLFFFFFKYCCVFSIWWNKIRQICYPSLLHKNTPAGHWDGGELLSLEQHGCRMAFLPFPLPVEKQKTKQNNKTYRMYCFSETIKHFWLKTQKFLGKWNNKITELLSLPLRKPSLFANFLPKHFCPNYVFVGGLKRPGRPKGMIPF